jgi:magnesium chelatase subunit H
MVDDGYLSAADSRDYDTVRLFPAEGATSASRHDTAMYGGCPGMTTEQFRAHGVSLRPGEGGLHTLYVVRHGERESVEVLTRETIACLLAPGEQPERDAAFRLRQRGGVAEDASLEILAFLGRLNLRLQSNREMDGLVAGLRGNYLPPGPGGDLLQNPAILPTGRNTHAINPYAIPSALALRRAEPLTRALLERHQREAGRVPESIAMVLWGIDNIKKEGEAVAQVLRLLGVRPVRDGLNRVTEVEAIPLERLGRPRIDVVMTVSGIFRDLFASTMELLDRAVKRVAALEEPPERNFVRKHVQQQMDRGRSTFEEAATRVFSNAAGNYGTNVNFMVLQSQWEDAREL